MPVSEKTRQLWIEKGYEHFALYGPDSLSINRISKEIGSPRACFYHHFGGLDIFIEELLSLHLQTCQQFNLVGKRECKNCIPDLYLLLERFPIPLKFCKQLFINRSKPIYNYLFIKAYNDSSELFILELFSKQFGLKNNMETFSLWETVGESWYSRLDADDLSAKKMQQLAEGILNSILKFVSSNRYSKIQENG